MKRTILRLFFFFTLHICVHLKKIAHPTFQASLGPPFFWVGAYAVPTKTHSTDGAKGQQQCIRFLVQLQFVETVTSKQQTKLAVLRYGTVSI